MDRYERDMLGYGQRPPNANWPGGAKIAVQVVVNYEEGGENSILHGDKASEAFLSDVIGAQPWPNQRHWNMESMYEYGARAGFWRLYRMLTEARIGVTVFGVASALARSPTQVRAMQTAGWEIASHGLKWIEYKDFYRKDEREHMLEAIRMHRAVTGQRPVGWYTGRCSENTVELAAEEGGFAYVSDVYDDDLPHWMEFEGRRQLVIPYSLETNDMRFSVAAGFGSGTEFYDYLKDSFDCLYAEGEAGSPKMMSVGLHCRLAGRPGRAAALKRFLEYARGHEGVWFPRRVDIARHWAREHPAAERVRPSRMDKALFIERFGGVFEHSPWIAERAHALELGPAHDCPAGVHSALARIFRRASEEERLGVLAAHPDLAGKLASAKRLTPDSTEEQRSAGLDALTDEERATFDALNARYTAKFGFPFIIAVRDYDKAGILAAFQRRVEHDRAEEIEEAARQVERIAELRLYAMDFS
ncbi:allantoinase PuuE [Roseicyclus sp. F158]|uniref:Chitooligosaccharide deacetylase n=1 Tax=Tropicimonas omnivorans TaxID=3075590 RepID=A0ABU3DEA9_9RHOB|nr:allantoinase PuuE [Roseicyclus sp. F158]MDT0682055.1 allantoinase PuuE [Roseicyclus sp. F158]